MARNWNDVDTMGSGWGFGPTWTEPANGMLQGPAPIFDPLPPIRRRPRRPAVRPPVGPYGAAVAGMGAPQPQGANDPLHQFVSTHYAPHLRQAVYQKLMRNGFRPPSIPRPVRPRIPRIPRGTVEEGGN